MPIIFFLVTVGYIIAFTATAAAAAAAAFGVAFIAIISATTAFCLSVIVALHVQVEDHVEDLVSQAPLLVHCVDVLQLLFLHFIDTVLDESEDSPGICLPREFIERVYQKAKLEGIQGLQLLQS